MPPYTPPPCHPAPAEALERLLRGLRRAVEEREGVSARQLSRVLGRDPRYVDKALRGETKLRVGEVMALLEALGTDARRFFFHRFPLGGPADHALPRGRENLDLRVIWRHTIRLYPLPIPEVIEARAGLLLRERIRAAGAGQRALGRRLFGSAEGLRDALRGHSDLSFQHIFPVLAELGVAPGRFFVDLLGPENGTLAGSITWQSLLDILEPMDREGTEGLVATLREPRAAR